MSSKEYSPEVVGQSFIKQYYEMFAKNPTELHRFYKDESSFAHAEGHQVVTCVTSVESIRECISDLQLAGCRLDLSEGSIDAQRSEQGGVFLVVTGNLMLPGKPYHHFVQSFFLACQSIKGTAPSYYVRNSIFRLLGPVDSSSISSPAAAVASANAAPVTAEAETEPIEIQPEEQEVVTDCVESNSSTAPVTAAAPGTNVTAPAPATAPVSSPNTTSDTPPPVSEEVTPQVVEEDHQINGDEPESHPDHNTVASEPEYVNITIRENVETSNDEEQQTEADGSTSQTSSSSRSGQRSFAELVKGWGDRAGPEIPPPSQTLKPKASKTTSDHPVSPPPSEKGPTIHLAPESGPPSALYLNQLPEDVTSPDQLYPLFLPYGPIRKIDVHPKGYAFVNYTEGPSVAKVLELVATTPEVFTVNGHMIQVREKINKPKVPGGGGGGGAGGGGGGKDKKVGDKFKKDGWKPRTHTDKMSQGEKKPVARTKTEKTQGAKITKK